MTMENEPVPATEAVAIQEEVSQVGTDEEVEATTLDEVLAYASRAGWHGPDGCPANRSRPTWYQANKGLLWGYYWMGLVVGLVLGAGAHFGLTALLDWAGRQ